MRNTHTEISDDLNLEITTLQRAFFAIHRIHFCESNIRTLSLVLVN
jgi:hypothetical protein